MRPEDLAQVLRRLPPLVDPKLIVGMNPADDAAVYRLGDGQAVVFTADFFTPIVDDPADYGAIGAANSLSDVYAMGGKPILALNLVCFPTKTLPLEILSEILRGGGEVASAAGVLVAGGHTIDDAEPKYGMAVVGLVDPDAVWTKAGGRPGDLLWLTKPLGTGIVTTALKQDKVGEADLAAAVASMRALNRDAAVAGRAAGVRCATDITGYGLLGHLLEVCRSSGVRARIDSPSLPLLPGARAYAEAGCVPGGTRANLLTAGGDVSFTDSVDEVSRLLCADAQTSGGLLLAVPPDQDAAVEDALGSAGLPAARIGELLAPAEGPLVEVG